MKCCFNNPPAIFPTRRVSTSPLACAFPFHVVSCRISMWTLDVVPTGLAMVGPSCNPVLARPPAKTGTMLPIHLIANTARANFQIGFSTTTICSRLSWTPDHRSKDENALVHLRKCRAWTGISIIIDLKRLPPPPPLLLLYTENVLFDSANCFPARKFGTLP